MRGISHHHSGKEVAWGSLSKSDRSRGLCMDRDGVVMEYSARCKITHGTFILPWVLLETGGGVEGEDNGTLL